MMYRLILALAAILWAGLAWGEDKEGGIIGTGVVGEVTGVDAFEVGGMRFNLPENIELKGIDSVADLRMGMTLALSTQRDGSGWQATQLRRLPVLIGPVTGPGEVMGVRVTGDLPAEGAVVRCAGRPAISAHATGSDGLLMPEMVDLAEEPQSG